MGGWPKVFNFMMSWRFCDVTSRSVTHSSHITPIRRRILSNIISQNSYSAFPFPRFFLFYIETSLRLDLRYAKRRVCHIRVCHIQKFKTQIFFSKKKKQSFKFYYFLNLVLGTFGPSHCLTSDSFYIFLPCQTMNV